MGITFTQRCDRGIFGVSTSAFEPLKNQNAMAFVLADASANCLQRFTKGTGGFSFPFTGLNLDTACRYERQRRIVIHVGTSVCAHLGVQIGDFH